MVATEEGFIVRIQVKVATKAMIRDSGPGISERKGTVHIVLVPIWMQWGKV